MRDEPGIGAFVVALGDDAASEAAPRNLSAAEIVRLRETKKIVAARARAVFKLDDDAASTEHLHE